MRFSGLWHVTAAVSAAFVFSAAPALPADAVAAQPSPTPGMAAVGTTAAAVVGASTFANKIEQFDLSKALPHGAVVLYFFPKAFTAG